MQQGLRHTTLHVVLTELSFVDSGIIISCLESTPGSIASFRQASPDFRKFVDTHINSVNLRVRTSALAAPPLRLYFPSCQKLILNFMGNENDENAHLLPRVMHSVVTRCFELTKISKLTCSASCHIADIVIRSLTPLISMLSNLVYMDVGQILYDVDVVTWDIFLLGLQPLLMTPASASTSSTSNKRFKYISLPRFTTEGRLMEHVADLLPYAETLNIHNMVKFSRVKSTARDVICNVYRYYGSDEIREIITCFLTRSNTALQLLKFSEIEVYMEDSHLFMSDMRRLKEAHGQRSSIVVDVSRFCFNAYDSPPMGTEDGITREVLHALPLPKEIEVHTFVTNPIDDLDVNEDFDEMDITISSTYKYKATLSFNNHLPMDISSPTRVYEEMIRILISE